MTLKARFPFKLVKKIVNYVSWFRFVQKTGEVPEWFKGHAWKACVRKRTQGSNPCLSEIKKGVIPMAPFFISETTFRVRTFRPLNGSEVARRGIPSQSLPLRNMKLAFSELSHSTIRYSRLHFFPSRTGGQ
jgi:hypothetical protein